MNLSRSMLIGLVVSATLNVFLIGGVAGVLLARREPAAVVAPPPTTTTSAPAAVRPEPPSEPAATPQALAPTSAPAPAVQRPVPPPQQAPPPAAARSDGERAPLWTAGQGLSQASRQALRRALREAHRRNQPITRQARAERQAALVAMKGGAYDPAEVARRLAAARSLDLEARSNVEGALAAYAATLSPEERQALAEGLARVYGPRAEPRQSRP